MDRAGGYSEQLFVAEFYDSIPSYNSRKDVRFWVEVAKQSKGPVLELGCGTGRILVPVAKAGISITGLDLSRPMMDICRKKTDSLTEDVREKIELVSGDMREFNLDRKYNLVIVPFRAFQHLIEVKDQVSCLTCIRRHLNQNGILILDLFNPSLSMLVEDKYLNEFGEEPQFEMPDGRKVIRKSRTAARDYARQVIDSELIYYVTHMDGRKETLVHSFPLRYFFRYEIEHLLARTGFRVSDLYGDYDRFEFGKKDPGEMIYIAGRMQ